MSQMINKLKESKLCQRIMKVGLVYVALEVIVAVGALIYVTQEVSS